MFPKYNKLSYFRAGPIVGGLVNKFGCRPVCIAGGIVACVSLVLSTFAPNVPLLMLTYGLMGGFGCGMIYLPSIVSVGYYFEKRRALATGIAVCGSGVGCFTFAPLANFLLEVSNYPKIFFVISEQKRDHVRPLRLAV